MASGALDVSTCGLTAQGGEFVNVPKYVQAAAFARVAIGTVSAGSFTAFATNDGKVPVLRDYSGNKWYKHELARAGEDFGQKVAMSVGNQLAKRSIKVFDMSMQGAINAGTAPHKYVSGSTLSVLAVQEGRIKMGDNADQLTTMLIHSKPWNSLLKDMISTYKEIGALAGEILNNGAIETILGVRNVIVTDDLTPEAGATSSAGDDIYYTWLLTEGSLYYNFQQNPYVDIWEDVTNSDSVHYEKVSLDFVAAPRAMSFSTANPTDANLLNSGLWSAAYEDHRNLGVVGITSIGA